MGMRKTVINRIIECQLVFARFLRKRTPFKTQNTWFAKG